MNPYVVYIRRRLEGTCSIEASSQGASSYNICVARALSSGDGSSSCYVVPTPLPRELKAACSCGERVECCRSEAHDIAVLPIIATHQMHLLPWLQPRLDRRGVYGPQG
jgi:hypothetical protein